MNHPNFDAVRERGRQQVKSSWQLLLNYFLRGLLVLLPIALTVGIIIWLVNTISHWMHLDEISGKEFFFYALAIVLVILFVGFVTRGVVARQILDFFEGIIEKAPGLSFIFGTTRDVTEAFVGDKKKFTEPVTVEINEGIFKLGFLTQKDMASIGMKEYCAVYMPFCYGLSGEMMVVKREKVKPVVNQESSHWTKFIISGGVVNLDEAAKSETVISENKEID